MFVPQLFETLQFAAIRHQYQRRGGYDKLPYINHLIKVANMLIQVEKEGDLVTLQAAILHDILEDEHATAAELTEKFGKEVCKIVEELTDDMTLEYSERKRIQVGKAHLLSLPAQKIKIADKSCNICDIVDYPLSWDKKRKLAYIEWSQEVVKNLSAPLPKLEAHFEASVQYAMKKLQKI